MCLIRLPLVTLFFQVPLNEPRGAAK